MKQRATSINPMCEFLLHLCLPPLFFSSSIIHCDQLLQKYIFCARNSWLLSQDWPINKTHPFNIRWENEYCRDICERKLKKRIILQHTTSNMRHPMFLLWSSHTWERRVWIGWRITGNWKCYFGSFPEKRTYIMVFLFLSQILYKICVFNM